MTNPDAPKPSLQDLFLTPISGKATEEMLVGDLPDTPKPASIPPKAPINLPKYTILVGNEDRCWDLYSALAAQSDMVYAEDFQGPIYDMMADLLPNGHGMDFANPAYDRIMPTAGNINCGQFILGLTDYVGKHINLSTLLLSRIAETDASHDYTYVIRDGKFGNLYPLIHAWPVKDVLIIYLKAEKPVDFDHPPQKLHYESSRSIDYIMDSLRYTFA